VGWVLGWLWVRISTGSGCEAKVGVGRHLTEAAPVALPARLLLYELLLPVVHLVGTAGVASLLKAIPVPAVLPEPLCGPTPHLSRAPMNGYSIARAPLQRHLTMSTLEGGEGAFAKLRPLTPSAQ
jgi:hypothetical protein